MAVDVGVLLRDLTPAFTRLGPLLGEFAPYLPRLAASSARLAAALAPFAPAVQATMPALAQCAGLVAQNLADQLPLVGPRLYPVGQDMGAALVAVWPLLVPTGELVVAASHLAVATAALAEGLGPALARVVPAPAGAGTRVGAVAEGAFSGIASGLRGLGLAGPVDQARAGALTGTVSASIWTMGLVSRLLPALAPSAQAGATRILFVVLPLVAPVTARTADALTRITPSLVPAVRGGVKVATAFTDLLTEVVVSASRASEAVGTGIVPTKEVAALTRRQEVVRQQAPTINIVVYVGMRP